MTSFFNRSFLLPAMGALVLFSGALTGCSGGDDGSPDSPNADAAWSVTIVLNAADCAAQGGTDQLGEVDASTISQRLWSGTGATVNCAITPVGTAGAFAVDAAATMGVDSLHLVIPSITGAATQASPASGTITYATAQFGSPFDYGTPSFYFSDPVETVAPGKIWVTFTASALESASTASVCDLSASYAFFENCLTM